MANKKLSQLGTINTLPINAFIHVTDPTDETQSISGSDYKINANLFLSQTFRSPVNLASTKPTLPGVYPATQGGTYTGWLDKYGVSIVLDPNKINYIILGTDGFFSVQGTAIDVSDKADKSELLKKADLVAGKNLFNKATAVENYLISTSNGELQYFEDFAASDFINVKSSTSYFYNENVRWVVYYDSLKAFISFENPALNTAKITPNNAKYIRISLFKSEINTCQVELGTIFTSYEPYALEIPISQLEKGKQIFRDKSKIEFVDISGSIKSKNLFDLSTVNKGNIVSWVDGNFIVSVENYASDFIEIEPSKPYIIGYDTARSYALYDKGKVFISGEQNINTFTTPSNAKYVRFSGYYDTFYFAQLEQNTVVTSYSKFGIKNRSILSSNISKWDGVETNCLGDSITDQNKWQPFLVKELGLNLTSFGIGGTTISGSGTNAFNNDTRINALSATAKLIITMGGTNDWAQSIPLGSENSTTLTDFYGGLNVYIEKLLNKYKTAGISTQFVFIGTPYGEVITLDGFPNTYTNTIGLTTKDYAEAIRKRCLFYCLPYIDSSNFGWNNINIRDYIVDDGGLLHPNVLGGKRVASIVAGKLKTFEPIN